MPKKNRLSDLQLDEISFVGKGDNKGANILLLKKKDERFIVPLGKEYKGENKEEILKNFIEHVFKGEAATFDDIVQNREARDALWGLCYTLEDSLSSIIGDNSVEDAKAMINTSIDQFKEAITALVKGESMPEKAQLEKIQKQLDEVTKQNEELTKQNKELAEQLEKASKCPSCGAGMKEGACEKGCGGKKDDMKKSDDEDVLKGLPEAIAKEMRENREEIAKLKEQNLVREYVGKAAECSNVAKGDVIGNLLMKIAKFDSAVATEVFELLKGADARIKEGDLLKEKGKDPGNGSVNTAYDKIVVKAEELRKSKPELSKEQAFMSVYDSDEELRKQYMEETRKK